LGGRQIDPLVGVEAELLVGVDRVEPGVLQLVGAQFVDQANAAALLREIEQDAAAGFGARRDRAAQPVGAIAAQAGQKSARATFGMEPREHRFSGGGGADQDRKMLGAAIAWAER